MMNRKIFSSLQLVHASVVIACVGVRKKRGLANLRLTVGSRSLRSISRPCFFPFLVFFLSFPDFGNIFIREILERENFLTKNFGDQKKFQAKKRRAEKKFQEKQKKFKIFFCIIKKIFHPKKSKELKKIC